MSTSLFSTLKCFISPSRKHYCVAKKRHHNWHFHKFDYSLNNTARQNKQVIWTIFPYLVITRQYVTILECSNSKTWRHLGRKTPIIHPKQVIFVVLVGSAIILGHAPLRALNSEWQRKWPSLGMLWIYLRLHTHTRPACGISPTRPDVHSSHGQSCLVSSTDCICEKSQTVVKGSQIKKKV